jgi:hypothetical protein
MNLIYTEVNLSSLFILTNKSSLPSLEQDLKAWQSSSQYPDSGSELMELAKDILCKIANGEIYDDR